MRTEFDVIIVGASFGGLATASRLRGDVLLIDSDPIGSRQRSACGTFLSVPTALDLLDSVLQVAERGMIHAQRLHTYGLEEPLCTLDYRRFGEGLFEQGGATFLQAGAQAVTAAAGETEVTTDKGRFRARYVVDASGWRAALARQVDQRLADRTPLSFGLETEVPYRADAFHFWLNPNLVRDGVGWIFPTGGKSRIGLASYRGETMKAERVRRFLRPTGAAATSFHGGYFPSRLRTATAGEVFLVGDSAGQCLPLTGEGIRPAIYFGQRCGDLIQRAIDGEISVTEAHATYRQTAQRYRWLYRLLRLAQWRLPGLPPLLIRWLLRSLEVPAVHRRLLRAYCRVMPIEPPLGSSEPPRRHARTISQRSGAPQFGFSGGAHPVSDGPDR